MHPGLHLHGSGIWVGFLEQLHTQSTADPLSQVIPAHGPGVKAPSIHNGVPVLQGVRALCLRANNTELCSGGSDGVVLCWDLAGGTVGRIVKKIEVRDFVFVSKLTL